MSGSTADLFIRRARASDSDAVTRVFLLTGNAGESAEALLSVGEFIGVCYAAPYLHVKDSGGFVVVRRASPDSTNVDPQLEDADGNEIVACIVFTSDSNTFASEVEKTWYPSFREKYPLSLIEGSGSSSSTGMGKELTPLDRHYIKLIHHPAPFDAYCLSFAPAHMHINILPAYQRQGWGRRLMGHVVTHLRDEAGVSGIWLGLDPKNEKAARFYEKLGFSHKNVEGAPSNCMGLKFEDWRE